MQSNLYYSEGESAIDEQTRTIDDNEFREARLAYKAQVDDLSKMLRHQRNMKRIKKDCMKHMIAEPSLNDEKSDYGDLLNTENKAYHKKNSCVSTGLGTS